MTLSKFLPLFSVMIAAAWTRSEQVEDHSEKHSVEHGEGDGPREDAKRKRNRASNLRGRSGQGPEGSRARKEAKILGYHVRREAVHVLYLVDAVVVHQGARANAQGRDADIRGNLLQVEALGLGLWNLAATASWHHT